MPSLEFNGKAIVFAHHLGVPFRTLVPVPEQSVFPKGKGGKNGAALEGANLLIHGDNLHALKALMPRYAGRVDCVCIDPPYNTGGEGWVYNDKTNSPLLREWLQKTVSREDLERHDKWLCMMWPRMQLLRDLMADNGSIFVCIDDNEVHRLRMMMDEVFGDENFIAQLVWKSNPGGREYGGVAQQHEYILCYSKSEFCDLHMMPIDVDALPFCDGIGRFKLMELRNRNPNFNSGNRPNLFYPIYTNPNSEDENGLLDVSLTPKKGFVEVLPQKSAGVQTVWRWDAKRVAANLNVDVRGKKKQNGGFMIVKKARITGARFRSLIDEQGLVTQKGTLEVKAIFGEKKFDYPKPVDLFRQLLQIATEKDSIVLDSFAGSGTTAHAVLALNAEDGGSRQFILAECEDYADKITAERVRRVIKGVPKARDEKLRKGLGGNFTFCQLGDSVDAESMFRGGLPDYDTLACYVGYTATGATLDNPRHGADGFFAEVGGVRLHLIYKPDHEFLVSRDAGLSLEVAKRIGEAARAKGKSAIVFAASKFMTQSALTPLHVTFCQLPYAIYKAISERE